MATVRALKVLLLALVVSVGLYGLFRYVYPFGLRPCFLPCMVSALYTYANDHASRFPDATDPFVALQKLYPESMPDAEMFAGISGNKNATAGVVTTGGHLTSNESSWVYIPGLSITNDPNTIMIYERHVGLGFDGRRAIGRAVGFVNGSHRQMPEPEFQQLLQAQQNLQSTKGQ